jgi:transcription-repair coupling factor (superfamily II helicase)
VKGEVPRPPAEVRLDLPVDANLPAAYVPAGEQRLEAYRRLAAVTTRAEVDDIRAEWLDRYGPLPEPAERLLDVATLRAACVRAGVREVTVARDVARLSPVELRASQQVRLRRLAPKAVLKEEARQLVLPLRPGGDPVAPLVALLDALVPEETTASPDRAPVPSMAPCPAGSDALWARSW